MESLRIENLRCIKDSGDIPIKSLNVFVGQNSSGKSTFLRTFPLFRQSLETKIRGPILWYGQYVDFGSFEDALHKGSNGNEIGFTYTTTLKKGTGFFDNMTQYLDGTRIRLKPFTRDVQAAIQFTISSDKKKKTTYVKSIKTNLNNNVCAVLFNENLEVLSLKINNKDYAQTLKKQMLGVERGGFFPLITFKDKESNFSNYYADRIYFFTPLIDNLTNQNHKRTATRKLIDILNRFEPTPKAEFFQKLKEDSLRLDLSIWRRNVQSWDIDSPQFVDLYNSYLLSIFNHLLEIFDNDFSTTMTKVNYIAPVRASAERYYRIQDLSIQEVDFQGKNLPMFIKALNTAEQTSFQEWTNKNFGFMPMVIGDKGHLSVAIKTDEGNVFNVADEGFGYSQILPIITQLWSIIALQNRKTPMLTVRRFRMIPDRLFIIEQPELHLHPSLQALVIKSMVIALNDAKEKRIPLKIILETHSETIVNSIGHLILEGMINHDDVSVIVFGHEADKQKISIGSYDRDGYLTNWPTGFFNPKRV